MTCWPNNEVAGALEQAAAVLHNRGANRFRVRAYRRAAQMLRWLSEPVSLVLANRGLEGLARLPGIGDRLARTICDIVRLGYFPMLERLRSGNDPVRLLASVRGIDPRLAVRLHEELGLETLEDLAAAARDGRLEDIGGFGEKWIAGIRVVLAHRLHPSGPPLVRAASRRRGARL